MPQQRPQAIDRFIRNLPYDLGEQLTVEYQNRLSDIKYLTSGKFDYYTSLSKDIEVISLLLAMSIFYKRVVANFTSAARFTDRILSTSDAVAIQLGRYEFGKREMREVNTVFFRFKKLMAEYSIDESLFDYEETKQFLRKVKTYKLSLNRNG
jgi:hypothetical protein